MRSLISNPKLSSITLVIFVLLAFGLTTKMFFWRDDFMMLYKLEHINYSHLGAGPIGAGPYKYMITPHYLAYPLFGQNPFYYFAFALIMFTLVSLFYLSLLKRLGSYRLSIMVAIIFVTSNIGSEGFYRIINSWQNIFALFFAVGTFIFLILFFKQKRYRYYLLSILFFLLGQEFVYVRSQDLIFGVFGIFGVYSFLEKKMKSSPQLIAGFTPRKEDYLLPRFIYRINAVVFSRMRMKKIARNVMLFSPYLLLFHYKYVRGPHLASRNIGNALSGLMDGRFEYYSIFTNLGNLILPSFYRIKLISFVSNNLPTARMHYFSIGVLFTLVFTILGVLFIGKIRSKTKFVLYLVPALVLTFSFWGYLMDQNIFGFTDIHSFTSGMIGTQFLVSVLITVSFARKEKIIYKDLLLIAVVLLATQYISYVIISPLVTFYTSHRYMRMSVIGYSLFIGVFIETLNKKKGNYEVIGNFLLFLIVALNLSANIGEQRKLIDTISVPTRRLFESIKSYQGKVEPGSLLFIYPTRDINYNKHLYELFAVGSMPGKTVFSIAYDLNLDEVEMPNNYNQLQEVLVNNEEKLDSSFFFVYEGGGLEDVTEVTREMFRNGSQVKVEGGEGSKDFRFSTRDPIKVEVSASVQPEKELKDGHEFVVKAADYLEFENYYYQNAVVTTSSSAKSYPTDYLIDKRIDRGWRGNFIYWRENHHEEVFIDLKETTELQGLIWFNFSTPYTPTDYSIHISQDGFTWKTVKEVKDNRGLPPREVVVDNFEPQSARYVKIAISNTFSEESPGISELKLINTEDVDSKFINGLSEVETPLFYDHSEVMKIRSYLNALEGDIFSETSITSLNVPNNYTFYLNPDGYKTERVFFSLPYVSDEDLIVHSVEVEEMSIKDLEDNNLIKFTKGVPYDI